MDIEQSTSAQVGSLVDQMAALAKDAESKRQAEQNPNLERIHLGMRDAFHIAEQRARGVERDRTHLLDIIRDLGGALLEVRCMVYRPDVTAFIDRAATLAGVVPVPNKEGVAAFAIDVEKALCTALGREWSASGISIESLIAELAQSPATDPVVEANRKLLLDRSRTGIAKYGVTLAASGLSRDQLVQHALEEALDLANYLQSILMLGGAK